MEANVLEQEEDNLLVHARGGHHYPLHWQRGLEFELRDASRVPDEAIAAYKNRNRQGAGQLSGAVGLEEMARIVAKRLYFSDATAYVYIAMLLLNLSLLVWSFQLERITSAYIALEFFVTVMLIGEVALRLLIQGSTYFRHFSNLFDIFIAVCCSVLLAFSLCEHLALLTNPEPGELPETVTLPPGMVQDAAAAQQWWAGPSGSAESEVGDILAQSLLVFRFCVQLLRMVALAMHHARHKSSKEQTIDFSALGHAAQMQLQFGGVRMPKEEV